MPSLKGDLAGEVTFNLRKKGGMKVNWAELPAELLVKIIEDYLDSVDDYVVFSSVCSSWRKATWLCDFDKLKLVWARQMPWLMLTDGNEDNLITEDELNMIVSYQVPGELDNEDDNVGDKKIIDIDNNNNLFRRSVLNLKQGKFYNLNCPQGYGRTCWGSGHGWIVTNGLDDHNMYLFNPFTKAQLNLPSRLTLPYMWKCSNQMRRSLSITKAIVVKVPSDDVYGSHETLLVFLIYDNYSKIAVANPGDTRWRQLKKSRTMYAPTDVVYHRDHDGAGKGGLVFLDNYGNLAYCDLLDLQNEEPPALEGYRCELKFIYQDSCNKDPYFVDHVTYIVSSGEDILMVLRIFDVVDDEGNSLRDDMDGYKTVDFKVYKFHFHDKSWEELHDLQGVSLFVGNNSTMCVRATDQLGCEHNCIYFTDDFRKGYFTTKDRLGGHDMGVFHMDDKIIRPLDVGNNHIRSFYCFPLWFISTI